MCLSYWVSEMFIIDFFTTQIIKAKYIDKFTFVYSLKKTRQLFGSNPYLDHISERIDDIAVDVSSSVRRCERIGESFSRLSSEVRHQRRRKRIRRVYSVPFVVGSSVRVEPDEGKRGFKFRVTSVLRTSNEKLCSHPRELGSFWNKGLIVHLSKYWCFWVGS